MFFKLRIGMAALAVSALISLGTGVSSSLASSGSVYFDTDGNAAAGGALFNGGFTGNRNVGVGSDVMLNLTSASDDSAFGFNALSADTSGANNTALGSGAGSALTTESNNVSIANPGVAGDSGAIRIGTAGDQLSAFVQGIDGVTIGGTPQPVVINAAGQLGTGPLPPPAGLAALATNVDDLSGGLDDLKTSFAGLSTKVDGVNGSVDDLHGTVDALSAKVAKQGRQIKKLKKLLHK